MTDERQWAGERLREGKALVADPAPGAPLVGDPLRFSGCDALPDLAFTSLDAQTVADAIASHGALIVRGFLPRGAVAVLRGHVADAERGRAELEHRPELLGEVMEEMHALEGLEVSAAAYRDVAVIYEELGVRELVGAYLGERPVMLTSRTALKRKERDPGLGWHQDAAVLGGQINALNAWTALTAVGDLCPSLDIVAKRLSDLVAVDEADLEEGRTPKPLNYLQIDGTDDIAGLLEEAHVYSPVLDPGDTVLFDEMTMHRTGRVEWTTPSREVLITWWFAPSRFPSMNSPISF